MRSLPNVLFLSFLCVFCFSTPMILAQEPVPCETDEDCVDGIFCNGWESCHPEGKVCVAVSSCPPSIDGCLIRGAYCDEENDRCVNKLDDSLCADEEFCSPFGECLTFGQDVGTSACGLVQASAQSAVDFGGPYRNHGRMVRTAARTVSEYVAAGIITDECSSCIVRQFAKRIPAEEQESCGLCPVNLRSILPSPTDVTHARFVCRVPHYVALRTNPTTDHKMAATFSSIQSCGGTDGPGFCYQVSGPPNIAIDLLAEEMKACDQFVRFYSQELEELEVLEVLFAPELASCPLLEP